MKRRIAGCRVVFAPRVNGRGASGLAASGLRPARALAGLLLGLTLSASWGGDLGGAIGWAAPPAAPLARQVTTVKTIRTLPRSESDVAAAHERASSQVCEMVPSDEPLEILSFTPYLSGLDQSVAGAPPLPSSRRHMFSVGLDVRDDDQPRMPALSRGLILNYLDAHFVSIQARVQRDAVTGKLFLNHRPLALTARYQGVRLSQEFTETVAAAVRDFHSLGVFVKPRAALTPEHLRTLVLLHKSHMLSNPTGEAVDRQQTIYEYVFVRGVTPDPQRPERMRLEVFITTDGRTRLHHMQSFQPPRAPSDCGIHATIVFTSYQHAQLYPKDSATRRFAIKDRGVYAIDKLDQYARRQGWSGDALDNLTDTLDAILAGSVRRGLFSDDQGAEDRR